MKLRAFALALAVAAFGVAAANCGSDDDTDKTPDKTDGQAASSGFVPGDSSFDAFIDPNTKPCVPATCADLKITCGPAGDGCGNAIQCGTCDPADGTCGGGGVPSVCGGPGTCKPKKCEDLGIECGPTGDGCGGKLECGDCKAPLQCGFGGPSKCGGGHLDADGGVLGPDGGTCVPRTVCLPGECGPVANGCGGLLQCAPTCAAGQICGGTTPSFCGPTCTKLTCTDQNANCGFAADGCGGLLDCGGPNACTTGQKCGLGGRNKCGDGTTTVDAGACTNYCIDQKKNDTCSGAKTSIRGTVLAPNGKLPVPGATVYIPNGSKSSPYGVKAFVDGTATGTCDQCNASSLDSPLMVTKTDFDGSFRLDNVPAEVDFPIVIQLGRWRRMITIPARTRCSSLQLTPDQARFPKKQNETSVRDSIPLIAVSTGAVDGLECVLYKLGIDRTEFTNPAGVTGGGGGRIRMYRDNDVGASLGGAKIDNNTPRTDNALTDTDAHLNQYDAVIFGCSGLANNRVAGFDTRLKGYADRGGRVFATHYNYTYFFDNPPWDSTVKWDTAAERKFDTTSAEINTTFPKGLLFSQWLAVPLDAIPGFGVGALTASSPPRITLIEARNNADLPTTLNAQYWMTRNEDPPGPGAAVFHYSFNTPVGSPPESQCGRVLFSDFHVSTGSTADKTFPEECGGVSPPPLTAQEKALAFFLFDLTSCVSPDVPPPPPSCKKLTCGDQSITCGKAGDGCGDSLDCTPCAAGKVCQGNPASCFTPTCTPTTCEAQNATCGQIADGCGKSIPCGFCDDTLKCGGNGPNKCGEATCNPITCEAQNIKCGPAGDGCGNLLECGPCPAGQTCGGGGVPSQCGAPTCTKRTCADANAECGPIADGCGDLVQCGTCPLGTRCGIGGHPNRCGLLPVQ